jgi:small subunit ribosomal protein S18
MAEVKKKVCIFCENGREPSYADSASLKKYLSDRSRIIARTRSGACSRHQRRVSREIKHARHLSLLPFVTRI